MLRGRSPTSPLIRSRVPRIAFVAIAALTVKTTLGCSDAADNVVLRLVKVDGDNQSALVGTEVTTTPRVRIIDEGAQGVSGVPVTFSAGSGGGTVTDGFQVTDGSGSATVGGGRSGKLGPIR